MDTDDDEAYLAYVEQALPGLRRVAYLLCQDWHRADDLVQATLERVYLHWRRAAQARQPAAYARTMLVRVFLTEQRTAWARRVVLLDRPPDSAAAAEPDLANRLALEAALRELPPRQRAVVVLRFYCDLSVEQTAETLHCAQGTVKSQAAKGLAKLREALTENTAAAATRS
ncbi:SigE family RNA polymerase sigma factor [Cryptosporangium minutisporangium]|uniref:SigE family RNA polymerase sigma factor n=1 Tax=Cryptosporangium minutisporangium TaxID=113569 RepID=A0ABP6SSM2_9ACTN